MVYVVVDTLGTGRVLGVFSSKKRAEAVAAANPCYYALTEHRLNELSDEALSWAQSEDVRDALQAAADA